MPGKRHVMRKFTITGATHKGKHIEVTKYIKTADGIEIQIEHNVPSTAGKQLRWVQTVTENGTFYNTCKLRTYVDPFGKGRIHTVALPAVPGVCKADDAKPFYYTDAEFAAGDGSFYDRPSESPPASGRTWIKFITALTEVTGTKVHHLVAISWGFDRLADGTVLAAAIVRPTTAEMKAHGQALKRRYPSYTYT